MLNNTLFIRFTFFSLISFIITGITLGLMISYHIRTKMMAYTDLSSLDFHLMELGRIIFLVMFFGLLILYLLLTKLIYHASKTLVYQNKTLQEQKKELELSYKNLNNSFKSTIKMLSSAVDARDPYTAGHSERVTELSVRVGSKLGLSEDCLNKLEIASLFHDIGKLGIPDSILLKSGKLTDEEFDFMKRHPEIGVKILQNNDSLNDMLPIILHHHERYSGNGYPEGLNKDEIPIESRIIAVTDSYDAMTTDRPYRKALSHADAITEINKNKGEQFDPDVVNAFISIIE